jgi:hypothetical protein
MDTVVETKRVTNRAIAKAAAGASEAWKAEALDKIYDVAYEQATLTPDDIWDAGLEKPREPRALGAVVRRAASLGFIEPTDKFVASRMKSQHRNPLRVWRSLVWKGLPLL